MNKYKIFNTFLLISFLCSACYSQHKSNTSFTQEKELKIETFVNRAMQKTDMVPGLGVAVVIGDEIVYANGFGLRDVEKQLPVTAETGFYIASKTKSFVAMTAACLENKGILNLNAALSTFYPNSKFELPLNADSIDLIKTLSHNHQIQNGGLQFRLAFMEDMSHETFSRILFDLSSQRQPGFRYSNLSYNIIGDIIEQEEGKSWKDVVRQEVLDPAGLNHTTAYMSKATNRPFAYPYFKEDGTFKRLSIKKDEQMQSAGGMVSTPVDLAKWIILNMNNGRLNGKQVLPESVLHRVHQPYATLDRNFYLFHRKAYELGWYRSDYEGDELNHHFGSYEGYMVHVSYMPEHNIGVVALSNELEVGGRLPHLVAAYIYDLLLDKGNLVEKYDTSLIDWQKSVNRRIERILPQVIQNKEILENAKTNPKAWNTEAIDFVGSYFNPRLGHIDINRQKSGTLVATFGTHSATLLPIKRNQFLVDWNILGYTDPLIRLSVNYNQRNNVDAIFWGRREFRRLASTIKIEKINDIYSDVRKEIKAASIVEENIKASILNKILEKHFQKGIINELMINAIGYHYLGLKKYNTAKAMFQFNVNKYPLSANVYDSLGEVYLALENKEMAKVNYESALILDTENERIKKILEEL